MSTAASGISRRSLVKGATLGAVVLGGTAASALADEVSDSYTYADTIAWDAEYDVVVLGIGFAGMVSAMEAADDRASVLLAEKAPDGPAGGNSRVCGQCVGYAQEDPENAKKYYRALAGGREISDDMLEIVANGIANTAGMLSDKYGFDRNEFVYRTGDPLLGFMCPEYPEFPGSDNITVLNVHDGHSDAYLYFSMRSRIEDNYADKIDIWFESPGKALIQDPISKAVIGVQIERKGEIRNVHALNGVCVCTGGFECNTQMVQDYLGEINMAVAGGTYNDGDGILMCQDVGARLWHMSAWEGWGYTSYNVGAGHATRMSSMFAYQGAGIIVGDWGKRIFNETESARHGHYSDGNGIWENLKLPEHMWVIFDETQMGIVEEYGGIDAEFADTLTACSSIAEAAEVIGCDEANLQKTIDNFNMFVELGEDYEFGHDASTMRAFDGKTYYVLPVMHAVLNTQGGPERNTNAEILDLDGNVIPHLYSAGEMGAFTTCMYNGGTNVACCFIMGQIAGANAATPKDPLPTYTLDPKVESNPAHLGDETDLVIG